MATITQRESAKILAFPTSGRRPSIGFKSQLRSVVEFKPAALPVVDYDAWYHQEAVESDKKPVN